MKRIIFSLIALGGLSLGATSAMADHGHGHYSSHHGYHHHHVSHYHAPRVHYHVPRVHYHTTFHPTYSHSTPYGGYHTHGHYHVTPHYGW